MNEATDLRRIRRPLLAEELARLIGAAEAGPTVEGIAGADRAILYLLATWTGYRRGELASLERDSFDLDGDPPTLTVQATYSKRRRADTLPIHPGLVERLRAWLAAKPKGEALLPVATRKTAKMVRRDLERAREAWIGEAGDDAERVSREGSDFLLYVDQAGRVADFHAARHTFISKLSKAGVSPKMAQDLARHSDIRLTMGVYTHLELADLRAGLEALPGPPRLAGGPTGEPGALRATGTAGAEIVDTSTRGDSQGDIFLASGGFLPASRCIENDCQPGDSEAGQKGEKPRENRGFSEDSATRKQRVDDGTRTRDPQIHHLEVERRKIGHNKGLGRRAKPGVTPRGTRGRGSGRIGPHREGPGLPALDPQLQRLVDAWPSLPEPIRRAVAALIDAAH